MNTRRQHSEKKCTFFSGRQRDYSLKVRPVNSQPQVMDEVQQNVMEKVEPETLLDTQSSKEAAGEFESGIQKLLPFCFKKFPFQNKVI